jgi:hypothetical protein
MLSLIASYAPFIKEDCVNTPRTISGCGNPFTVGKNFAFLSELCGSFGTYLNEITVTQPHKPIKPQLEISCAIAITVEGKDAVAGAIGG